MRFLENVISCNQFFIILILALTLVLQRSSSEGTQDVHPLPTYLVRITGKGILSPPKDENDVQTVNGIIIDKNIVLSLYPKFSPDSSLNITAGAGVEQSLHQSRQSVNITRHPCFPELNVAIIYLDKPLEFNEDSVEPAWIISNNDRITPESLDKPDIKKYVLGILKKDGPLDVYSKINVDLIPCGDETSTKYLQICVKGMDMDQIFPSSVLTIKGPEIADKSLFPYVAGFLLNEENTNNNDTRRFLDLTKLTCWISGDPISCEEDPNIGAKACGKNLNDEWWNEKGEGRSDSNETDESTSSDNSTEEDLEHLNKTTPDPNASDRLNKLDFYRIGLLTLIIISIFSS